MRKLKIKAKPPECVHAFHTKSHSNPNIEAMQ
jgi:hypothetical protein